MKRTNRSDQDTAKIFAEEIVSALGLNVHAVLLYGSTVDGYGYDIDLLVILDQKQDVLGDTQKLRAIRENYSDVKLDLQLLYLEELVPENSFSLDAHGAFIVSVLKSAITLFGTNPFLAMEPDALCVASDALQKIQYYIFRARQAAFGCGVLHKDTNPDLHRKKLKKIMQDILLANGMSVKSDEIEKKFFALHTTVFNQQEMDLFTSDQSLEILEALPLYERLYHFALGYIPTILFPKTKPALSRFGDIVFEFLPAKISSERFVILCEGMPSIPSRRELMQSLSDFGWNVLYPRYRGTWESPGNFLEQSPRGDIQQLCDVLVDGLDVRHKMYRAERISIIGSSFGGGVALTLADHPNVSRVIALSPIVDFKASEPILHSLKLFLQNMYPGAYRFSEQDWARMSDGELLQPINHMDSDTVKKIHLFGGGLDPEILIGDLRAFSKRVNVPLVVYPEQSHLSFSKLTGQVLRDVLLRL